MSVKKDILTRLQQPGYLRFQPSDGDGIQQDHIANLAEQSNCTELEVVADLIRDICLDVQDLLIEKNRKYGNSALNPLRIFSRADPIEAINVRIDDKLSRIKNRQTDDDEDPELDLIGYLVLKQVARRLDAPA